MKRFLFIILLFITFGMLKSQGIFSYISLDSLQNLREQMLNFGIMTPILYILFYIIVCLFFLPAIPLTLLSGILFGPWMGIFYAMIGSSLGMAASFLSARYIAREFIENKFGGTIIFKKIDQGVKNHDWGILMTTRLIPIFPSNVQNYVYGLTEINFFKYWILSTLFTIPSKSILVIFAGNIINNWI